MQRKRQQLRAKRHHYACPPCHNTISTIFDSFLALVELFDKSFQWLELVLLDQLELLRKKEKVLKARVEVRLLTERLDHRHVRVVNVGIDAEEPLKNVANDLGKVLREIHV